MQKKQHNFYFIIFSFLLWKIRTLSSFPSNCRLRRAFLYLTDPAFIVQVSRVFHRLTRVLKDNNCLPYLGRVISSPRASTHYGTCPQPSFSYFSEIWNVSTATADFIGKDPFLSAPLKKKRNGETRLANSDDKLVIKVVSIWSQWEVKTKVTHSERKLLSELNGRRLHVPAQKLNSFPSSRNLQKIIFTSEVGKINFTPTTRPISTTWKFDPCD